MAIGGGLFHAVAALVDACTKHVSRATRKLRDRPSLPKLPLGVRGGAIPFLGMRRKKSAIAAESRKKAEEEGVWRREILMGEKCQPLEFSGVIYYDSAGRQLAEVPAPRSQLRSPLPSFSFQPVVFRSEKMAGN